MAALCQWADERQSELGHALEVSRADGATLQQNLARATAEADRPKQECGQLAQEAQATKGNQLRFGEAD